MADLADDITAIHVTYAGVDGQRYTQQWELDQAIPEGAIGRLRSTAPGQPVTMGD